MTRKEQKEERKQAILMSALSLFVEKGYHDTKISDIAEAVSMSMGLMFHYFSSKEELLLELVKQGREGTNFLNNKKGAPDFASVPADVFLTGFLTQLFSYAKQQPWVFNMFCLMSQARKKGMPEEARQIALSLETIPKTALLIKKGQADGIFREGDALSLSQCFWAAVQGVMEEMAWDKSLQAPDPAWLISILKKA